MEETYDLQEELKILDPEAVSLSFDAFGDLQLQLDGGSARKVEAARPFPLTSPDGFVVLRDAEGDEVGAIRSIAQLEGGSRRVLRAVLEASYFLPVITRVHRIDVEFRIPRWEVETDRGPRSFEISSMRSDVRQLGDGRVLLRDADGNRYDIPNRHALDAASQALIDAHL